MRIFRPWYVAESLYPGTIFRIKTPEKNIVLTFDDGPDPGSTIPILESLERQNIKAIFFCAGAKAEKHPELINSIKVRGHVVGNHGYSHLDGWKTSSQEYLDDVQKADHVTSAEIFRPPYGHFTTRQYAILRNRYRIYLWDLMPYDFDRDFGPEKTLGILKKRIRPGSVIVLHDKPESCALKILDEFVQYALSDGFRFVLE
jgi:peptidoglycan/xylan/chitin deacetylase (PgdA/CDA1 family)